MFNYTDNIYLSKKFLRLLLVIILGYMLCLPLEYFSQQKIVSLPTHIISLSDFSLIDKIDFIEWLKFAILPTIFTFCFLSLFKYWQYIKSIW